MKKQTTLTAILILSIWITSCGPTTRNDVSDLKTDSKADTDAPTKGVVYAEIDGSTHAISVSESQVVVPDSAKVYFQEKGSSVRTQILPPVDHQKSITIGDIEYFFVPQIIKLKKIPTQVGPTVFGTYGVETNEKFYFKLNQQNVGTLGLIKRFSSYEYNNDGISIEHATQREEPLKSALSVQVNADKKTLVFFTDAQPDELVKLQPGEEQSPPRDLNHLMCAKFEIGEASPEEAMTLGYIPPQIILCNNKTNICGEVRSRMGTHSMSIADVNKLPRKKCIDPGIPPAIEQTRTLGVSMHIKSPQSALLLLPIDVKAGANTQLLRQKISIDQMDISF